MSLRDVLLQNWDYVMDQEDWYPPALDALKGVTAEQALWKPEGSPVNSIWENVLHLLYYKQRLLARLEGTTLRHEAADNDETFIVHERSEEAWRLAQEQLKDVQAALRRKIEQLPEEELEESPQRFVSLITHDAYHIGQLIMLRKMQGSWPAKRHFS